MEWTAKNILDFAWAADRDYSVDEFTVLGGPKVYFVYQKSEKTKYWEEAKPYVTKYFQIMNAQFGQYAWPSYSFIQGGDGGMEYGMCTMILGEAKSVKDSYVTTLTPFTKDPTPGFTSYAEAYVSNQLFPPAKPQANPFVSSINSYIKFVKTGKEEPASWLGDHHDDGTAYTLLLCKRAVIPYGCTQDNTYMNLLWGKPLLSQITPSSRCTPPRSKHGLGTDYLQTPVAATNL
ncbi:hypothetical protein FQR65_LT18354 [Abscondita terminalis]|nr:hypothetical protein FQR65_LT18354 [Abscondita terminalis]